MVPQSPFLKHPTIPINDRKVLKITRVPGQDPNYKTLTVASKAAVPCVLTLPLHVRPYMMTNHVPLIFRLLMPFLNTIFLVLHSFEKHAISLDIEKLSLSFEK